MDTRFFDRVGWVVLVVIVVKSGDLRSPNEVVTMTVVFVVWVMGPGFLHEYKGGETTVTIVGSLGGPPGF